MQRLTNIVSSQSRFQICAILAKSARKMHRPKDQLQDTLRRIVDFMQSEQQRPLSPDKTPTGQVRAISRWNCIMIKSSEDHRPVDVIAEYVRLVDRFIGRKIESLDTSQEETTLRRSSTPRSLPE
jgi:hypothetical protein